MQKSKLLKLCQAWQKTLRIQDWDIAVEMVGHLDDGASARVEYFTENRTAFINIDRNSNDYERSLVHELLHVQTAHLRDIIKHDSMEDILQEQVVNCLAQVLVDLKRGAGITK